MLPGSAFIALVNLVVGVFPFLVLTKDMETRRLIDDFNDVDQLMAWREGMPLFGGLSEEQARHVFSRLSTRRYKAGEVVFHQDDFASHIYIVLSGTVQLVFDFYSQPLIKTDLHFGDCFGETSVIGIQTHSTSAVIVDDVQLLVFNKSLLLELFEEDKELFAQIVLNIARETCRRSNQTDQLLAQQLREHSIGYVQLPLPGISSGNVTHNISQLN